MKTVIFTIQKIIKHLILGGKFMEKSTIKKGKLTEKKGEKF